VKPAGIASRGALTRQLRLFEGGTQREGHAIADAGPRSSWRLRSILRYYVTTVRLHSVTASRRSAGAAGRREAQSRTTGAGRARRRGTPMQSRTREGAGTARRRFLPAFEAHAGPTPCSTLTGRWGQGATGGVVHLRDAQARHPTGHAAYLSHVSQAARRPGGRRTATAAAGEAGGLKTHHEMSGPVQRCRPHVTRREERTCTTMQAAGHARRATARVEVKDARGHSISHPAAHNGGRRGRCVAVLYVRRDRRSDKRLYLAYGGRDATIQEPSLGTQEPSLSSTSRTARAYGWATILPGWSGSGRSWYTGAGSRRQVLELTGAEHDIVSAPGPADQSVRERERNECTREERHRRACTGGGTGERVGRGEPCLHHP